ncbi:MAG: hypothetical protein ACOYON_08405 [Fimbriimonas sp.]
MEKLSFKGLSLLVVVGILAAGCSNEASVSKDEERNFKQGMTAEQAKKIGPPPPPPSGPLEAFKDGSDADKAKGR